MGVAAVQRAVLLLARVCFLLLELHCYSDLTYISSGAPSDVPSLVSRTVTGEYYQRQCPLYFPEVNGYTYGSAKGKTAAQVNSWTKGWDLTDTTRLTWTNGYDQDLFFSSFKQIIAPDLTQFNRQYDPWREAGVSSGFRPGGPLQSRPSAPVHVIPDGIHCSDLILENGVVNEGVQAVIDAEVAQIKEWVAEYYQK